MVATVGIRAFDLWRPGYGGATVTVVRPGTVTPIPIYLNHDATVRAENPQTLLVHEEDGVSYGRFRQPIYAAQDYFLIISEGGGETIHRLPLTALEGQDAGAATLRVPNTMFPRSLANRAAYDIHMLDYGDLSASAAENTDLIDTAIGVAAAAGGGIVRLPRAAFDIQSITNIPSNVRLVGHGVNATIMRASVSADIITLTGVRSGIEGFTLDGVTLPDNSVGVRLGQRVEQNEIPPTLEDCTIRDVLIRRFAKGIEGTYGGSGSIIRGGAVAENNIGVELDAADGDIVNVLFSEVEIDLNIQKGIALLSSQDYDIRDMQLRKCRIKDGTELLDIEGAKNTIVTACSFRGGNSAGVAGFENLAVNDVANHSESFVDGLLFQACSFMNMRQRFQGRCRNLRYDNCRFVGNLWEIHAPENNILLLDCDESADRLRGKQRCRQPRAQGLVPVSRRCERPHQRRDADDGLVLHVQAGRSDLPRSRGSRAPEQRHECCRLSGDARLLPRRCDAHLRQWRPGFQPRRCRAEQDARRRGADHGQDRNGGGGHADHLGRSSGTSRTTT